MPHIEHRIGDTSVIKVHELDLDDFTVTQLLPSLNLQFLAKHPKWIAERTYDQATEKVVMSVHTWVVKHNGKTILIDTGRRKQKRQTATQGP